MRDDADTQPRNMTKRLLASGGIAIGFGVRLARTLDTALIAETSGFDFIYIDVDYAGHDFDAVTELCAATTLRRITPIVRVAQPEQAIDMIDAGALGIVLPMVNTVDEARSFGQVCRTALTGRRRMRFFPQRGERVEIDEDDLLTVVLLETREAIAAADDIAALMEIDALMVGFNDLAQDLGIEARSEDVRLDEAMATVVEACRRHGTFAGFGGTTDPARCARYLKAGARFCLGTNDAALLARAAGDQLAALRAGL